MLNKAAFIQSKIQKHYYHDWENNVNIFTFTFEHQTNKDLIYPC